MSASSSSTGVPGAMEAKDRSTTSMTSGSPSAMSRALASRLSNFCPLPSASRSAAWWSAERTASVHSRVSVATTVSVLACSRRFRRATTSGAINSSNHPPVTRARTPPEAPRSARYTAGNPRTATAAIPAVAFIRATRRARTRAPSNSCSVAIDVGTWCSRAPRWSTIDRQRERSTGAAVLTGQQAFLQLARCGVHHRHTTCVAEKTHAVTELYRVISAYVVAHTAIAGRGLVQ